MTTDPNREIQQVMTGVIEDLRGAYPADTEPLHPHISEMIDILDPNSGQQSVVRRELRLLQEHDRVRGLRVCDFTDLVLEEFLAERPRWSRIMTCTLIKTGRLDFGNVSCDLLIPYVMSPSTLYPSDFLYFALNAPEFFSIFGLHWLPRAGRPRRFPPWTFLFEGMTAFLMGNEGDFLRDLDGPAVWRFAHYASRERFPDCPDLWLPDEPLTSSTFRYERRSLRTTVGQARHLGEP